jgi:hypothetical protein
MDTHTDSAVEEKSDEELDVLWTAAEIGRFIRRKPSATNYLLARGLLDADKIGGVYVSTKTRIRKSLNKTAD